jgi:hypothetical protein
MKAKHFLSTLAVIFSFFSIAQNAEVHEKKIYQDSTGKVHVHRSLPIYLSISTSPDGSNAHVLKGQDPKYSYPMFLDSEGYNSIRSPWKVDPETKETIYPKEDVIFEVYADSKAPASEMIFTSDKTNKVNGKTAMGDGEISLIAKDALSGVQNIYYSINKAPYKIYSSPLQMEEKEYTIKYYAVDNVGNAEEPHEIVVYLDKTAPETKMTIDGDLSEMIVSSRSTIALNASDKSSKVSKTYYTIDGGKTITYLKPIAMTILSEGEHSISYFSEDILNNKEENK